MNTEVKKYHLAGFEFNLSLSAGTLLIEALDSNTSKKYSTIINKDAACKLSNEFFPSAKALYNFLQSGFEQEFPDISLSICKETDDIVLCCQLNYDVNSSKKEICFKINLKREEPDGLKRIEKELSSALERITWLEELTKREQESNSLFQAMVLKKLDTLEMSVVKNEHIITCFENKMNAFFSDIRKELTDVKSAIEKMESNTHC